MKPTLLTILFFLLFAITTYFPLAFTIAEQVKDSNGNPVLVSKKYFIWPASRSGGPSFNSRCTVKGGGLWLNEKEPLECPVAVEQDLTQDVESLPLSFIPTEKNNDFIYTGSKLDIVFEKKTKCAESSKWVLVDADLTDPFVGIGVNDRVIDGLFKIEKLDLGYQFVYCPTVNDTCMDIGRYYDTAVSMRLYMSDFYKPFEVVFVDVDASGKSVV